MAGNAKLFTDYESNATSIDEFLNELKTEFKKKVNSALIHDLLRERKKKNDESTLQYFYEMMAIASRTNMEPEAIMHHVN